MTNQEKTVSIFLTSLQLSLFLTWLKFLPCLPRSIAFIVSNYGRATVVISQNDVHVLSTTWKCSNFILVLLLFSAFNFIVSPALLSSSPVLVLKLPNNRLDTGFAFTSTTATPMRVDTQTRAGGTDASGARPGAFFFSAVRKLEARRDAVEIPNEEAITVYYRIRQQLEKLGEDMMASEAVLTICGTIQEFLNYTIIGPVLHRIRVECLF